MSRSRERAIVAMAGAARAWLAALTGPPPDILLPRGFVGAIRDGHPAVTDPQVRDLLAAMDLAGGGGCTYLMALEALSNLLGPPDVYGSADGTKSR